MMQQGFDIAITLTFQNQVAESEIRRMVSDFWNRTERKVFHNDRRKRILKASFFEKGRENINCHYHVSMKTPSESNMSALAFCHFLEAHWNKYQRKYRAAGIAEFEPIDSIEAWNNYTSKSTTRYDVDALDVSCSNLLGF
jgi:hypothetical protein